MSAILILVPRWSESDDNVVEAGWAKVHAKIRHDNPHWPVSSRADAEQAQNMHRRCDPGECSTRVAASIVVRNNFQYFRDRMR
ncbi:hypothetical protein [Nocardia sp. NPDC057440]|uniref:hypothetical protein n=1 Tax=Nocardia sp. NPDC057440 TaxID=3346134 RepID=UPI00366CE07A